MHSPVMSALGRRQMADFDIERLIELTSRADASVAMVTLRVEEAPEDARGAQATARYLNLDERLRIRFRTGLRRMLLPLRSHPPVQYEPGWVGLDQEVAEGDDALLEGGVMPAIRDALGRNPGTDFAVPARPETDDEAELEELVVGGYVIVVRHRDYPTAYFIRRRDPVEHVGRNRFTGLLDGNRLNKADRVFIFDSSYDIAIFDGQVLIRNHEAFEALFSNVTVRRDGARQAVATLVTRMRIANPADLDTVIADDTRFAGRLRAIDRRGQLARLDPAAVRVTTQRFGIDHRMLRGDELLFVPAWRWHWLSVLEDSLVESPGTQALYSARIKREWCRYQVTCVTRNAHGEVAELGGDFGRVSADTAMRQLRNGSATYFVECPDGRAEIDAIEVDRVRRLVARVVDDETDRLADLPPCPAPAAPTENLVG